MTINDVVQVIAAVVVIVLICSGVMVIANMVQVRYGLPLALLVELFLLVCPFYLLTEVMYAFGYRREVK